MLPSNDDKKMLIESMKKLTNHISNNYSRQKDIFQSLSKQDIMKIFTNLSDENQYLRRISGLLLIELLYNNNQIRSKFVKMLQIYPSFGRICLNNVPQTMQKYPSTFKKCIQLIKSPVKKGEQQKMCWTINLDRKVLQIQYLQYKKYSSFTFLDPNKNIFGITFLENLSRGSLEQDMKTQSKEKQYIKESQNSINKINETLKPSPRYMKQWKQSKQMDSIRLKQNKERFSNKNSNNKYGQRQRSSQSQRSSRSKNDGLHFSSNSFYKSYIDARNRLKESPISYKQSYEKKQSQRPNTSRNHKELNLNSKRKSESFRDQSKIQKEQNQNYQHTYINTNLSKVESSKQAEKSSTTTNYPHSYTQIINNESLKGHYHQYDRTPFNISTTTKFKDRPKSNTFYDSIELDKQKYSNKKSIPTNENNHNSNYLDYQDRIIRINGQKQRNRVLHTQRKAYQPNYEKIGNSQNSSQILSQNDRYKIPDSAKNSYTYTNQHQKFYKRVKEILKE